MSEPKRCCEKPVKFVIVYVNDKIISVCDYHSKRFEYRRNVKWIFDYLTKKELTQEQAFGEPKSMP